MDTVRAVNDVAFDLTLATAPISAGRTVKLSALYGIDGTSAGIDTSRDDLVFPVDMDEGASGVYSTEIILPNEGVYWARFTVDSVEVEVVLARVVTEDFSATDARVDSPFTMSAYLPTRPASVQVTMSDSEGASVGNDLTGTAYVWPQAMTQVPGYTDSWYFTDVTFDESSRVQVAVAPVSGPIQNDVITVSEAIQTIVFEHFNGWEPDDAYVPADWVPLSYIRRWTGWTVDLMSDQDLRELRRTAIETFINETNIWIPSWTGSWNGVRAQGTRLYLQVPMLLPSDGGVEPVLTLVRPEGEQDVVDTLDNDDLIFRVRGRHTKQPYVEYAGNRAWDHTLDVKVYASWGLVGPNRTSPIKTKQVLVGLIRWHSLSFGVDGDDAREQATLNRILSEGNRDVRATYDPKAVGDGITGDRTVDRVLAEFTVQPQPWAVRGGALPASVR